MTAKELVVKLFKESDSLKIREFGTFIENNLNNDNYCFAKLFHKGYNELSPDDIKKAISILLNSQNKELIVKSIKYIRKEYFYLIEEILPKISKNEIYEILRTIDSDQLRLKILLLYKNDEEIVISAIKRIKDKNILPDDIKNKYNKYLNTYIATIPVKDYDNAGQL